MKRRSLFRILTSIFATYLLSLISSCKKRRHLESNSKKCEIKTSIIPSGINQSKDSVDNNVAQLKLFAARKRYEWENQFSTERKKVRKTATDLKLHHKFHTISALTSYLKGKPSKILVYFTPVISPSLLNQALKLISAQKKQSEIYFTRGTYNFNSHIPLPSSISGLSSNDVNNIKNNCGDHVSVWIHEAKDMHILADPKAIFSCSKTSGFLFTKCKDCSFTGGQLIMSDYFEESFGIMFIRSESCKLQLVQAKNFWRNLFISRSSLCKINLCHAIFGGKGNIYVNSSNNTGLQGYHKRNMIMNCLAELGGISNYMIDYCICHSNISWGLNYMNDREDDARKRNNDCNIVGNVKQRTSDCMPMSRAHIKCEQTGNLDVIGNFIYDNLGEANKVNKTETYGVGIQIANSEGLLSTISIRKNIIANCNLGITVTESRKFIIIGNKMYNIFWRGIFLRSSSRLECPPKVNEPMHTGLIDWNRIQMRSDNGNAAYLERSEASTKPMRNIHIDKNSNKFYYLTTALPAPILFTTT